MVFSVAGTAGQWVLLKATSEKDTVLRLAGPGAGKQARSLETLLAAAPALAPKVEAAEWVGNRRWNLTFRTGQLLALPEGEVESATALVKFAKLDGQNRLLGGKELKFFSRTHYGGGAACARRLAPTVGNGGSEGVGWMQIPCGSEPAREWEQPGF